MGSHRSVARFSRHTSLVATMLSHPPHTTTPGSVASHSLIPKRDDLHTRIILHADTSPTPCLATFAQNSGRDVTRSTTVQVLLERVVGGAFVLLCAVFLFGKNAWRGSFLFFPSARDRQAAAQPPRGSPFPAFARASLSCDGWPHARGWIKKQSHLESIYLKTPLVCLRSDV